MENKPDEDNSFIKWCTFYQRISCESMVCTLNCTRSIVPPKLQQRLRNICPYNSFVTILYLLPSSPLQEIIRSTPTTSLVSTGVSETNNRSTGCSKCFPHSQFCYNGNNFPRLLTSTWGTMSHFQLHTQARWRASCANKAMDVLSLKS